MPGKFRLNLSNFEFWNHFIYFVRMFQLVLLRDILVLHPHLLSEDTTTTLTNSLNRKYINKVIYNVGLAIALFDIIKIADPIIFPGQGDVNVSIEFRLIVFKPLIGEVLVGEVIKSSIEGIVVGIGFFKDILIPPECLPQESHYSEADKAWYWKYVGEDGDHELFIDSKMPLRFRVTAEIFTDVVMQKNSVENSIDDANNDTTHDVQPYRLIGEISDSGLGILSWWD